MKNETPIQGHYDTSSVFVAVIGRPNVGKSSLTNLLVDEDGSLKCKAANQKATQLAPADVTENGKQPIVGAAVLMFQRGDKLLGFTKHVADTICSEWL